uniref:protein-serine/threonine phosphatase n=1 Tax=Chenopodium quinoa TaxID=63459 RepID=A0A803LN73_CHEQI
MNSSLTKSEINRIRDNNLQYLLNSKKLHLILDFDHTLVHSRKLHKLASTEKTTIDSNKNTKSIEDNVYKTCGGDYMVKLRPGVREFIKLGGLCKGEAKGVDNVVLSHERVVVIVDDTVTIWEECCKRNLLQIGGYKYFPIKKGFIDQEKDTELVRVVRVLMLVHTLFYDDSFVINNAWPREYGSRDVRDALEAVLITSRSGFGLRG